MARALAHLCCAAAVVAAALCAVDGASGQNREQTKRQEKLRPTHADVRYGPHERNVLDLYLAKSDQPTPLVLFIHGGGFRAGDKGGLDPKDGKSYLDAGFSIAAINYRFTDAAPMPAAYLDCARALQFLRQNAKQWRLDPELVASTGASAGAGTSLWLAFHDDLADPGSEDPVARQSTRLACVAVHNGQSSYDPRFAERIGIPRPNFERHPFFLAFYGITADEMDTPKAYQRYEQAAPITYLSKDDPPTMMYYTLPNEEVKENTPLGVIVHHPKLAIALKEQMDRLGIACVVQYLDQAGGETVRHDKGKPVVTPVQFIAEQFRKAKEKRALQPVPQARGSEAKDDFLPLFDGKTLNGWSVRGGKAAYKVEDGTIVGSTTEGSPNTFLCTDKEYGDFELMLEVQCNPELNSGIQIRSHVYEKDTPQPSQPKRVRPAGTVYGYQCEIARAEQGFSGNFWDEARRTEWLDEISNRPEAVAAFQDGQWNRYRIVAQGERIRSWVNGVPCADFRDSTDAAGFIGLQVHGVKPGTGPYQVRWRNIRIREL